MMKQVYFLIYMRTASLSRFFLEFNDSPSIACRIGLNAFCQVRVLPGPL